MFIFLHYFRRESRVIFINDEMWLVVISYPILKPLTKEEHSSY
jgi:hypothetical protein